MKVILLQDVAKIGKRGEVATVPDGYGMNQLIPKRMAILATPEGIKKAAAMAADTQASAAAASEAVAQAVATIKEKGLTVTAEANDQDHLFEALKPEAVEAAAVAAGIALKASDITMEAIKELGEQTITIGDQSVAITVAKA